jgi:tetratricopeptide (TPR) repeat protein
MDPALGEAKLALGNLHRVRGEYAEALGQYRKVAEDPRIGPSAHVGMAKVYAAQGRKDLARQNFELALALRPGDALTHAEIGWQAHLDGRVQDAINEYRKALALEPDNAGSWNTLGFFYLLTGANALATQAFERSIAIKPNADALSNIGTLKFQSGEYGAAVELYRKATELDPDDHVNWGNLGEGLLADSAPAAQVRAAFAEADKRAGRYLQLNPDDGEAVAALGWYRVNLGLDGEAVELVGRSAALKGDQAEIALYNAETLAALGKEQDSLQQIGRARAAGISEARIKASAVLRRKRTDTKAIY